MVATCNPADPAQKWVVAKSQSAEYLRVRNPGADRCVGISGNSLSNGRAIADWACTNDSSMAWYLDPNGMMTLYGGPNLVLNTNYDITDVPVPEGIRGAAQPVALVR